MGHGLDGLDTDLTDFCRFRGDGTRIRRIRRISRICTDLLKIRLNPNNPSNPRSNTTLRRQKSVQSVSNPLNPCPPPYKSAKIHQIPIPLPNPKTPSTGRIFAPCPTIPYNKPPTSFVHPSNWNPHHHQPTKRNYSPFWPSGSMKCSCIGRIT